LLLALHDLDARLEELGTDDQRHQPCEAEEDERRDQVHVADRLVVGRGDPLDDRAAHRLPLGREPPDAFSRCGHASSPPSRGVVGTVLSSPLLWLRSSSGPSRPVWPRSRSASMCASYSSCSTTLTLNSIPPWCSPHSSAHLPA